MKFAYLLVIDGLVDHWYSYKCFKALKIQTKALIAGKAKLRPLGSSAGAGRRKPYLNIFKVKRSGRMMKSCITVLKYGKSF